jgi:arylsulfatase A-like enzyme
MTRPNVIVFFTDQQRWDTCGAHGNPLGLTPHYDRLAAAGTHARLAFTCQPICGPARSCLQTGLYPTTTGCYRNRIPLPPGSKTLAHYFAAGGYATSYIGKWHLAAGPRGPVAASARGGYDYWLAANATEMVSDSYDCRLWDQAEQEVRLPGYRIDAVADAAIRHIAERVREPNPFFLFLSFLEPHHQNHRDDYPAPDGYAGQYTGRWTPPDLAALGGTAPQHLGGYYGMVKRLDEALGRLLDTLKSLDQLDNTIIVFTSDHGCHFRTRNEEYKQSGHEASVRVPLAFHGPGFTGGGELRQLISLIDLPPTLLDAAGLPVPSAMQGRSLVPLVRGGRLDWPDDVFIQISEPGTGRAIRTSRWKYGVYANSGDTEAPGWAPEFTETYLYDLLADPSELTNLIGFESHQAVAERLRTRLHARMAAAGEQPVTIRPAPHKSSGQRRVSAREVEL